MWLDLLTHQCRYLPSKVVTGPWCDGQTVHRLDGLHDVVQDEELYGPANASAIVLVV
jgi:hypothetical protein